MKKISFYGASGAEHVFTEVTGAVSGFAGKGIAVFTASDSYGRRVVRVVETDGASILSAFLSAKHYGANSMFVLALDDAGQRTKIAADLEAGLSPVMAASSEIFAMAA